MKEFKKKTKDALVAWKMEEHSGNLRDEKRHIQLSPVDSPDYRQDVDGVIGVGYGNSVICCHQNLAIPGIDLDNFDFNIVLDFATEATQDSQYLLSCQNSTLDSTNTLWVSLEPDSDNIRLHIYEPTSVGHANYDFDVPKSMYNDGAEHRLEIQVRRASNALLLLDEVPIQMLDISAQTGPIKITKLGLGAGVNGFGGSLHGTLCFAAIFIK